MKFDLSLYLVTDRSLSNGRDIEWIVNEAVKGGVTMVQLREKECSTCEFIHLAERLMLLLKPLGVPLIINDRLDVVLAADADGIHIGQSDMPYEMARKLLGKDKIIGLSIEKFEELAEANRLDVDYVAISPVYATTTKTDTSKPFGLEGACKVVAASQHPTVAIGGINASTIGDVIRTGVDGVAIVSAIVSADSPCEAAADLRNIIVRNKMKWSQIAWGKSLQTYQQIIEHPFNVALMQGTLSTESFICYLGQDAIYMKNYHREMLMLVELLPEENMRELVRYFADEGLEAEHALHKMLSSRYGIETSVPPVKATKEYMLYTRKYIESGDLALSLAAILPCIWIYNEVGAYIYAHQNKDENPYKEWIATYSSAQFTQGVIRFIDICDELAAYYSPAKRAEMLTVFEGALNYEIMLWDTAYWS